MQLITVLKLKNATINLMLKLLLLCLLLGTSFSIQAEGENYCLLPNSNQWKIFIDDSGVLKKSYGLKDFGDYWQINFNIKFIESHMLVLTKESEEMKKEVQEAIAHFNARDLLADENGKNFYLSLNQVSKEIHPAFIIKVNQQSNITYQFYRTGMTKETIIHELLHLTGLVDEYKSVNQYQDCRVPSVDPKSNIQISKDLVPTFNCRHIGDQNGIMGDFEKLTNPEDNLIFSKVANGENLFLPAHSRKILKPKCFDENRVYNSCAKNAYEQTCHKKFGVFQCPSSPNICNEEIEWLK